MDYVKFYKNNKTAITVIDKRLSIVIGLVAKLQPKKVLDIGCGEGLLISELQKAHSAEYFGLDVYELQGTKEWNYKSADITKGLPYESEMFDCVIMGEVIEHLPDPDFVLEEVNRVLKPTGRFIVTTPNLVSWCNRVLVLFGIQPLFTETSTKQNLGRKIETLGQGRKVQGHLKIFTHNSLKEILELSGFKVVHAQGAPFFFPKPISYFDDFVGRFISLASNLVFTAEKRS